MTMYQCRIFTLTERFFKILGKLGLREVSLCSLVNFNLFVTKVNTPLVHFNFFFFGGGGGGRRLFEAGHLLTFSTFRLGAYSRWALIQGWTLK